VELGHPDFFFLAARGKQRRFVEHVLEVGPNHARRSSRDVFEIDVARQLHFARVHLKNGVAPVHRGDRRAPGDRSVRGAAARVENFRAVGCSEHDDAVARVEPVHLDEQLIQRLLALIGAAAAVRSGAALADGVELVDEHDGGRLRFRLLEQLAHARRADADEDLDELGAAGGEKGHAGFAGDGASEQRLARAGGPTSSAPFGTRAPSDANFDGLRRNLTISSSSSLASSTPATESKPVVGRPLRSRARSRPRVSALIDFTGFMRLYDMPRIATKVRPAMMPRISAMCDSSDLMP
jgi:hypothetical protein